ncbi:MAG: hypothetical protein CVV42_16135 [Candidatus Riflebacteria bacterium HGW-Riflebacteria-2]|jgi:hypothetical protein|nr:MAG: hypothetical protein CVV42_16135 [Candidatus Riflebacteria bacterium HGW-Riflebacteria-2]
MKNICKIIIILALLVTPSFAVAEDSWHSQGSITADATGLVEAVLPAELHEMYTRKDRAESLDLSLFGPDGNSRAFELSWRSAGEHQLMDLQPQKRELLDDRRLVIESNLPAGYSFNFVRAEIDYDNYAGKADIECELDGKWQMLATGVAVQRDRGALAVWADVPAAAYSAVRLTFSGYDRDFSKIPVFVRSVRVTAKRMGSDYVREELRPLFEEATIDNGSELRVMLPGSGLSLETLEVKTAAPFKGSWEIGFESMQLGRRDFGLVTQGRVEAIGSEPLKLTIDCSRVWKHRVMLIRLVSDNYFGRVDQVKVLARLPTVVFAIDQPGEWIFRTGLNKPAIIMENPGVSGRVAEKLIVGNLKERGEWRSENLLKNYSLKGGPFNSAGYAWKSAFNVDSPGFYQLVTDSKIGLDRFQDSLRIVKDEIQVPYFLGRSEVRHLAVIAESSYDQAANRTTYLMKLPQGASLHALRIYARGIFERNILFERHVAGKVSWQPWETRQWKNRNDGESALTMSLRGFPEDQTEIRMHVDHGSNQPLDIYGISGLYSAHDLFFIAHEAGEYELFGGNPAVRAPTYDLAIIQQELLDMTPTKIPPGPVLTIADMSTDSKPIDQGAPFSNAGYSWVATFSVTTPGFYQLGLNMQASLDDNKKGQRLVKNDRQVPFFAGASEKAKADIFVNPVYDKAANTTTCEIKLPAASKQWQSLRIHSSGVFSREAVLETSKPGRLGWQTFKKAPWTSRSESSTVLEIQLSGLREGETELRLVIAHGDNSPIEISAVEATYYTESLFFHAAEAGEYQLYGGNSKARAPVYDLALIKDHMLKNEPNRIKLGEAAAFTGDLDIKRQFNEAFSETGWGLYVVLGVVTLLLIVIIIRLFPEDEKASQTVAAAPPADQASAPASESSATAEHADTKPSETGETPPVTPEKPQPADSASSETKPVDPPESDKP